MSELIRYEYHRPGKSTSVFHQWLVLDRPDVKVLLSEDFAGADLRAGESVIHQSGAPMIWYVFPEKWHDVGRFHDRDENHTGWYTNLITPVEISTAGWRASDLFLDLWQPVEGDPVWLDADELVEAVEQKVIDAATRKRIQNERVMIDLQIQMGAWPPAVAKDIDLQQARALKETGAASTSQAARKKR